jgi:SNF2 family DNA or RNA helicase
LIEHFLQEADEATEEDREKYFCGISPDWVSGINYFRIDGQTNVNQRALAIKKFNNPNNYK